MAPFACISNSGPSNEEEKEEVTSTVDYNAAANSAMEVFDEDSIAENTTNYNKPQRSMINCNKLR